MTQPVPDLLRDAAEAVRRRGLARRFIQDTAGRVCLAGALNVALAKHAGGDLLLADSALAVRLDALTALDAYLGEQLGYSRQFDRDDARYRACISVEWSNEVARDAEDVAQLMEKCAAWTEERA